MIGRTEANRGSKSSTFATTTGGLLDIYRAPATLAQGVLELEIAKAIPDTIGEVVVYGERGLQSLLAATTLLQKGYSNVSPLAGGWCQWISGGGEIEK